MEMTTRMDRDSAILVTGASGMVGSAVARLLAARGFRLVDRTPVAGADGKRVAFLHPAAGRGVLIELSEKREGP